MDKEPLEELFGLYDDLVEKERAEYIKNNPPPSWLKRNAQSVIAGTFMTAVVASTSVAVYTYYQEKQEQQTQQYERLKSISFEVVQNTYQK